VLSALPGWTPEEVRTFLESTAVDKGPVGMDNDYGHGRVMLGDALDATCSYGVAPMLVGFDSSGGGARFDVAAPEGCSWTAVSSVAWIDVTDGGSGTGNGSVSYQVAENPEYDERTGTVVVDGSSITIEQAGTDECSYQLTPTSQAFPASGGAGSFAVATGANCGWEAQTTDSWIHIAGDESGTGPGAVSVTVDANTGDVRTGSVVIGESAAALTQFSSSVVHDHVYRTAGVARTAGVGGVAWRSSLCLTNLAGADAQIELTYRHGRSGSTVAHAFLEDGATSEWPDVVLQLFGVSGDSAGSVEVASDVPVMVTDRTFSETSDGTYGQYLPGARGIEALAAGQTGVLPQIKKTDEFRTNVGFVNLGESSCTVRIRLFNEDGDQVGSVVSSNAGAGRWQQENDIFNKAGVDSCDLCYATVEVVTVDGLIWAYASVVDNESDDPTTIPMFVR
jgi:hypothetical protein